MSTIYIPDKSKPLVEVIHTIDDYDIQVITIDISIDEYQLCEALASNMWCSKKIGEWGRGLINSRSDNRRAERVGKLGELAFAKLFQLPFDTEYRRGGDEYDFLLENTTNINIKTAAKRPNFDAGLIKAETKTGRPAKLNADIYVFSFIKSEDRDNKSALVSLVGSIKREKLVGRQIVPARVGCHKNYEILYSELDRIIS